MPRKKGPCHREDRRFRSELPDCGQIDVSGPRRGPARADVGGHSDREHTAPSKRWERRLRREFVPQQP